VGRFASKDILAPWDLDRHRDGLRAIAMRGRVSLAKIAQSEIWKGA